MKSREELDSETVLVKDGGLGYIEFNGFLQHKKEIGHCMSTRIGGVSSGEVSSLNLGYSRKDLKKNVDQNFRIICSSAGFDTRGLVFSNQVHGTKIGRVTVNDKGKGFIAPNGFIGCDGLMTNEPGVTLVTFYADCVPLLFYDPVRKVIAASHSGWKGTLKNIAAETIDAMSLEFNSSSSDIVCVIGPSIGSCCFEVDYDVYELFAEKYADPLFYKHCKNGKTIIDLKGIIKSAVTHKGVRPENVHVSSLCTKCRNDLFYSYRGDHGKTGSLAAFIQIRETKEQ